MLTPEMIAALIVGAVAAVLGWLAKGRIERIEAEAREREDRCMAYTKGHADRLDAVIKGNAERFDHELREKTADIKADVDALGGKVQRSREEMIGQYVHKNELRDALATAFKPISDGIERIERNVDEVFRRLDGKADRAHN